MPDPSDELHDYHADVGVEHTLLDVRADVLGRALEAVRTAAIVVIAVALIVIA